MKFWVGIGLIGLLALALIVDSARLFWVKSQIANVSTEFIIGPENADLTVVEFMDYSNPACRRLEPFLAQAVKRDGKVRLIPKPVLPEGQTETLSAAVLAYAAGRQGKFKEAHRELLKNYRVIDEAFIEHFARILDIDLVQLKKDMKKPEILKKIRRNRAQLEALKSRDTPTLLIGNRILYIVSEPLPSSDKLLQLFAQGRLNL